MSEQKVLRTVVFFVLAASFAAMSLGLFAQATPPGRINYQGVLRDNAGNPLTGLQSMTFRFYDDPVAGVLLWEETYSVATPPQVTVSGGLFGLALGDAAHKTAGAAATFPDVFASNTAIYLGVVVDPDAEMVPRIQMVAAPFALNADSLDGKHAADFMSAGASGSFLDTSATPQTQAGKLTCNSAADYGIDASGPLSGGYFHSAAGGQAHVGGSDGINASGATGGIFQGSGSGHAEVASGDIGIDASGSYAGGYFHSSSGGQAYLAGADGINAWGTKGGLFSSSGSGHAEVAVADRGIDASGTEMGGHFSDSDGTGFADVGTGNCGIVAKGSEGGGRFDDLDSIGYAYVGVSTYKIWGTGTPAFVQNHPAEKDKVIVYACPEGDEVATYTRGTARLVNGARRGSSWGDLQVGDESRPGLDGSPDATGEGHPVGRCLPFDHRACS